MNQVGCPRMGGRGNEEINSPMACLVAEGADPVL